MDIRRPTRTGTIEVITGPMFAGKSEELMRRVRRATIAGLRVVVVNHALDDRAGTSTVSSHAGGRIPATSVSGAAALLSLVNGENGENGGNDGNDGNDERGAVRQDGRGGQRASPKRLLDLVAVDEAQVFGADLVPVVIDLADRGSTVVVSGLCLTFDDQPFEPLPTLMAAAESVTKLLAVCAVCGADAAFHRKSGAAVGNALAPTADHVGGVDSYQARCRRHR